MIPTMFLKNAKLKDSYLLITRNGRIGVRRVGFTLSADIYPFSNAVNSDWVECSKQEFCSCLDMFTSASFKLQMDLSAAIASNNLSMFLLMSKTDCHGTFLVASQNTALILRKQGIITSIDIMPRASFYFPGGWQPCNADEFLKAMDSTLERMLAIQLSAVKSPNEILFKPVFFDA